MLFSYVNICIRDKSVYISSKICVAVVVGTLQDVYYTHCVFISDHHCLQSAQLKLRRCLERHEYHKSIQKTLGKSFLFNYFVFRTRNIIQTIKYKQTN